MRRMQGISVILHDIRSSENVGSIFRTSDAAGVKKIYLTGYTPAPVDRFKRPNTKLSKASLGAEQFVPWESFSDIYALIEDLQRKGVSVVAVEQHVNAIPYTDVAHGRETAFIFGNEVAGVPQEVLEKCDKVVEIPMYGKKESLNVSVSAGIILFSAHNIDSKPR